MNSFSNPDHEIDQDESIEGPVWLLLGKWWIVASISIVLFVLTLNPLLAGAFPYVRAGWPAVRTAFWLKFADPWSARGSVGLLFHLCMASFRAGVTGLACVVGSVVAAEMFKQDPNFIQFAVAMIVIVIGCFISFLLGWIGVVIALRHGVRIFVISNLYKICHGNFSNAEHVQTGPTRTNPAHFIVAIAIAVPSLTLWFAAILMTMPLNMNDGDDITVPIVILSLLPVLAIACLIMLIYLSKRIMARSPAECWGAPIPDLLVPEGESWA